MKPRKHTTGIGLLMLISQLLLTLFVVQWLFSGYREEKANLRKELDRTILVSSQQALDTLLVKHLINPILNKDMVQIHIEMNSDSTRTALPGKTKNNIIRKFIHREGVNSLTIISSDSLPSKIKRPQGMPDLPGIPDSMSGQLVNEVRLLLKESGNLPGGRKGTGIMKITCADSLLFKKITEANLKHAALQFPFSWRRQQGADTLERAGSFYFGCKLMDSKLGIEISGYNSYLYKRMTAQLVFALVLLLLTGMAFYIGFRSLRNQIMLSAMKDDLISNMSHELKTPVSTVKLVIESLQNYPAMRSPEVMTEYLNIAALEMDRLDQLISKVLDASLLTNGRELIRPEAVEVTILCHEVLDSFKLALRLRNATATVESDRDQINTQLDPVHVRGVLANLLDNSLKYGNDPVVIQLKLSVVGQQLLVTVTDNGPGIPNEYTGKVFEKFFRVPAGNLHNVKGYGLGLHYAAQVMKLHGGTIRATTPPAGGCQIVLAFPMKP